MCSAEGSVLGLFSSGGIVGSSYVMVSAAKWAIMCVSGKGPVCGVKFWYQLLSGIMSMVTVFGSFLANSLAQCKACCASVSLCGWAYPIPLHLYSNAVPRDPNTLSLGNGE